MKERSTETEFPANGDFPGTVCADSKYLIIASSLDSLKCHEESR